MLSAGPGFGHAVPAQPPPATTAAQIAVVAPFGGRFRYEGVRGMTFDINIILAEIFGTGFLILLGDGVVAGVLLAKSKTNMLTGVGNSNGWIVITAAWAFAVFVGVVVAAPISGPT
jgi:hypothetical protein